MVGVRAVRDEQLGQLAVPLAGGAVQRRAALPVRHVTVGPALAQQLGDLQQPSHWPSVRGSYTAYDRVRQHTTKLN